MDVHHGLREGEEEAWVVEEELGGGRGVTRLSQVPLEEERSGHEDALKDQAFCTRDGRRPRL